MHKIDISGVVHQNLSSICNLCNAEGNHEIEQSQIDIKVPKSSTNPNPRETREREREERRGYPGPLDGAREDGRPMERLRRPEERRTSTAAAVPREGR
jgi:hypothetical protein